MKSVFYEYDQSLCIAYYDYVRGKRMQVVGAGEMPGNYFYEITIEIDSRMETGIRIAAEKKFYVKGNLMYASIINKSLLQVAVEFVDRSRDYAWAESPISGGGHYGVIKPPTSAYEKKDVYDTDRATGWIIPYRNQNSEQEVADGIGLNIYIKYGSFDPTKYASSVMYKNRIFLRYEQTNDEGEKKYNQFKTETWKTPEMVWVNSSVNYSWKNYSQVFGVSVYPTGRVEALTNPATTDDRNDVPIAVWNGSKHLVKVTRYRDKWRNEPRGDTDLYNTNVLATTQRIPCPERQEQLWLFEWDVADGSIETGVQPLISA